MATERFGRAGSTRQWLETVIAGIAEEQQAERPDLGRELYAWTYRPRAARKRRAIALLVVVFAIAVLVFYLARARVGAGARVLISALESGVYGVVGYLVKRVWDAYQPRHYELYERGIVIAKSSEQSPTSETVFRWKRFKSCELLSSGVQLKPVRWYDLGTTLFVNGPERLTVYNICMEMISRARSERLVSGGGRRLFRETGGSGSARG